MNVYQKLKITNWIRLSISLLIMTLEVSCDSPDANTCFKTAGDEVEKTLELDPFAQILINREVRAFIEQGDNYQIRILSGENLIEDVTAIVENGRLTVTDDNICNLVREYGNTTVYITAPDINEIRTSTQYDISSIGVLNYDQLTLLSESFNATDTFTVGDFRLQVNCTEIQVISNNISSFYIEGQTQNLNIGFFNGVGRFEGADLVTQNIELFHRGSNDMIVNPQQSLSGQIVGPGDVIAVNTPPLIEVSEEYTGRLILTD